MGYMRHHAFVVTDTDGMYGKIVEAHAEATRLGLSPTELTPVVINGYRSFMVPPDGSKEGWTESDEGNVKRYAFVAWLLEQCYEDGSSPLKWAEVQYGDDEDDNRIVACSGRKPRATP